MSVNRYLELALRGANATASIDPSREPTAIYTITNSEGVSGYASGQARDQDADDAVFLAALRSFDAALIARVKEDIAAGRYKIPPAEKVAVIGAAALLAAGGVR